MASLFSEALDFALPKAGKDSNFKLKTEQKLITVADFFIPFARTVTFPKNFQQIFVRRTSSQTGVTSICPICFKFPARFSFIPSFPKLLIVS